jgi:hypothetical protein
MKKIIIIIINLKKKKKKKRTPKYDGVYKIFTKHYDLKFKMSKKSEKECKMPNMVIQSRNKRAIKQLITYGYPSRE